MSNILDLRVTSTSYYIATGGATFYKFFRNLTLAWGVQFAYYSNSMIESPDESLCVVTGINSTPVFVRNHRMALLNGTSGGFIMMRSFNTDGQDMYLSMSSSRFFTTTQLNYYAFVNTSNLVVTGSGYLSSGMVNMGWIVNDTTAIISLSTGQILMIDENRNILWQHS